MKGRVLVTGASGFVGCRMVELLSQNGWHVRACQRRSAPLHPHPAEIVKITDICTESDWSSALKGVDIVLHLAARAHKFHVAANDSLDEYRRVNRDGTLQIARQAAKNGVKRFVFVSSVGVNGNHSDGGVFRESDPANPKDDYAISKHEAEQGLMILAKQSGLEVVIVRPPLVYGPDAPGNMARLMRLVGSGFPLPFANIRARRSYISLDNLIDFLQICLEHPIAADEVFLVSDADGLELPEIIRQIAAEMKCSARLFSFPQPVLRFVFYLLGRSADYQRLVGTLLIDAEKARNLLGWSPPYSAKEGIRQMVRGSRKSCS